ncbi:hypothetical protein B0H14DRAFT_3904483 [Mycena olivaceomarginata]|nr:hypothetical protein B0H14DRAFT_3904483 [Mycena olivaceomarginata]
MIEIGCPPHSSPSLALALSLLRTPRPHTAQRCAASPFPRPLPRHRVVAAKPRSLALPLAMPPVTSPSPAAASSIALPSRLSISTSRLSTHVLGDMNHSIFFVSDHYLNDRNHARPTNFLPSSAPAKLKVASSYALPFLFPFPPSLLFLVPSSHKYQWQAPKSAPASSTPSARAIGDDDASGSANGPFSAASKPPRALRNAHSGRIVNLAPNCCGYRVLQKVLDCKEEEVCLLTDTELSWTPPVPPSFTYVNKSLKGKYAALACHETVLLVVQRAKDGIVDELLGQGARGIKRGSYCIQHSTPRTQVGEAPPSDFEHSLTAAREGGKETLDCVLQRMCEPANGVRRAMIVDLAFSLMGSQLIASILAMADKDQRASLYDCIRGHVARLARPARWLSGFFTERLSMENKTYLT